MSPEQPEQPNDLSVDDDLDPAIAAALWHAYSEDVGLDVAARHLWRIHRAGNPVAAPTGRGMRRALVGVLTGLMLLMTAGGALAASVSTVPGDALYSVKRTAERTRLLLAISPETDARLHLAMARQRLTEADTAAVKRPSVVPRLIEDAVVSIEQAERSGDPAVAQEAAIVWEEVSEKAEALAVALEDEGDRELLAAVSERLKLSAPTTTDETVVRAVPPPPDRVVVPVAEEEEPAPVEPPVETAASTPGTTPEPTAPIVPAPAPRPTPPTPDPAPEPEGETVEEEPAEEEAAGAELPPADPRDSPGLGKDTQDLKPEPTPEPSEEEPAE